MTYGSHFRHADDIVNHLNVVVPEITDPLLKAKYEEAVQAYEDGKEVIHCLASCMIDEEV